MNSAEFVIGLPKLRGQTARPVNIFFLEKFQFFSNFLHPKESETSLESGFKCPEVTPKDAFGISDPHPKYADPSDCAKFYICLNGVTPREQGCELGLVYNEQTQSCDSPKNVPEW